MSGFPQPANSPRRTFDANNLRPFLSAELAEENEAEQSQEGHRGQLDEEEDPGSWPVVIGTPWGPPTVLWPR